MECNRCFTNIHTTATMIRQRSGFPPKKLRKVMVEGQEAKCEALECSRCRLIVCPGCKVKYEREQMQNMEG